MRILYTPDELDRTIRWYPAWVVVFVAIGAVRKLWIPDLPPATELSCGLMGIFLYSVSKSRSSPDIRQITVLFGVICAVIGSLFLVARIAGLRNGVAIGWLVAVDFALGTRVLWTQAIILASVYICHRGLDDVDEAAVEFEGFPDDAALVRDAV
jgi:hypothetical protein